VADTTGVMSSLPPGRSMNPAFQACRLVLKALGALGGVRKSFVCMLLPAVLCLVGGCVDSSYFLLQFACKYGVPVLRRVKKRSERNAE
jgi:hypothetical protein